jgi:hypothetical protein
MMIKDLYESIKDIWPVTQPLDFADSELSEVPPGAVNLEDTQRIVDWMTRIKQNYPELYVSQVDDRKK